MSRIILAVSPVLLLLSSTAAVAEPQCAHAAAANPSSDRGAHHSQHDRLDHAAASHEICHVYIKHFVEAVTARKDAVSCQDGGARRRALDALDAEIQAFNDRIAENSASSSAALFLRALPTMRPPKIQPAQSAS
jgi:hypothetical protein